MTPDDNDSWPDDTRPDDTRPDDTRPAHPDTAGGDITETRPGDFPTARARFVREPASEDAPSEDAPPQGELSLARQRLAALLHARTRGDWVRTPDGQIDGARIERASGLTRHALRRRRQLLLFQSMVITFMMLSSWIMVVVGYQVLSKTAYNFRAETQQVLEMIRDGHADEVYDDASPELQATIIKDRFVKRMTDMSQTLGQFRQILALEPPSEVLAGSRGRTARVRATLEFDKGTATGHFSFHFTDDEWRLLELSVKTPRELVGTVRNLELVGAYEAPTEVIELARSILEKSSQGKGTEVFDAASRPFQRSVGSREAFLDKLALRRQTLGRYVRMLDLVKGAQNGSQTHSQIVAVVEYERAKTDVTMKFVKEDGAWKLRIFKVVVPAPRIPVLRGSGPE